MSSESTHKVFPKIEDIAHMDVISTSEDTTVEDAIGIMVENNIRDIVFYDHASESHHIFMAKNLFDFIRGGGSYTSPLKALDTRELLCFRHDDNILTVYPDINADDEYFGVLDEESTLKGIISYTDITSSIDPNVLVERKTVGEVLNKQPITSVSPSSSTFDAFFHLNHVDDAVVVIEGGQPCGILTTKDMVNIIQQKLDSSKPISTYMISPVDTIHMKTSIKDVLHYLRKKSFKRAVVVDDANHVLGAVTQKDLSGFAYSHWAEIMRTHADELQELVGMLESKTVLLEHASLTDPLTHIGNRNSFNNALEAEIARFTRYGTEPFSLLMLDIDHFKLVNDQHGHLQGDEALKGVTKIVKSMIRDSDTFARWGGEEFALLLPLTELPAAKLLAERIRVKVSETSFQPVGNLTISLGAGQYMKGEPLKDFISRTDKALYLAKNTGRNRVCLAD